MPWRKITVVGRDARAELRRGTVSRRSLYASGARPSGRSWPHWPAVGGIGSVVQGCAGAS